MTQKETLEQIKAAGMSGSYSAEYGEWRVTYPAKDMQDAAAREAVAYYTPDSADAIATARAMRADMDAPKEQADNPTLRIAPHAAEAISALAGMLPDAERQPLHRDGGAARADYVEAFGEIVGSTPWPKGVDGPDQIERPEGDGVAKHVAGIAKMKADTFEDHVWDAVIKDADEFLAALPSYQIATHAADAITALASILPDAERQPLHHDYEPDEAAITHHMMTGEEPTRATLADLKTARAFSGQIEAGKAAADDQAARRGPIPRGPDLGR